MIKHHKRHKVIYWMARNFIAKPNLRKYHFKTEMVPEMEENFVMLANHLTESDMWMIMRASKKHTYFVTGEHLLRMWFGKLFDWAIHPVPAPRGANHVQMAMELMSRLREGYNISFWPEGCRSFNGETEKVGLAIGKLIKASKCALVTYHQVGGYFVAPRWAYNFRKGPIYAEVKGVYSSEQLAQMSAEEITDIVNRDLYENAQRHQEQLRYKYKGKNLAEGLENYLIICPECGSYDSMVSKGNRFECSCCHAGGEYDEYGQLVGDKLKFHNVYDWGKWQETRFDEDLSKKADDEPLFHETDLTLYEIQSETHERHDLATKQDMSIYKDRIEINGRIFRFARIRFFSLLYYGKTTLFTTEEGYFGITGDHFHAWKIERLYNKVMAEKKNQRG